MDGLGKERKGNVLFNDALNTFYLQLYDVSMDGLETDRWTEVKDGRMEG